MTALDALRAAPKRLTERVQERPSLRRITSPRATHSAIPFAVLVATILVAGMIGLMLLTTTVTNQAFEVRRAQNQAAALAYRVSDLESQVARANSPAEIAGRATELGMVPDPNGVFIDLATGRVVGEAKAVTGNEIPSLRVTRTAGALDPSQVQKVTTSVLPWFNLDGIEPPAPTAPPPVEEAR